MQSKLLYVGDLKVGDCFKSHGYTITLKEIMSSAEKYDPQPFHLDEK